MILSFNYNTRQPEMEIGHNERVSFSICSVCCAGWHGSNGLDLYLGNARFESRLGYQLS